jgi:hypothetical protein
LDWRVRAGATPKDIVKKLDSDISRIIKSPEISEQIKRMTPVPMGDYRRV